MLQHAFAHLLVIQPDDNNPMALRRALLLAAQQQCRLTVFKCCYQLVRQQRKKTRSDSAVADLLQQQQQYIEQQIVDINQQLPIAAASDIRILMSYTDTARATLTRLLSQLHISMVIKQQQENHTAFHWRMASLDHYLISDTDIPVWLVKASTENQEMNILACLDLDDLHPTGHALNEAILELSAKLTPAQPHALHVINCFTEDDYSMSLPYDANNGFVPRVDQLQLHQLQLAPYMAEYSLSLEQVHLSEGLPDDEIPKAVRSFHSQLAIIGNHHGHELSSALLGDTAHYLTEHLPCDVLIVKPECTLLAQCRRKTSRNMWSALSQAPSGQ